MKKNVNLEYFRLYREMLLLAKFALVKNFLIAKSKNIETEGKNKILLVCVCLIGEFASALPAISDFLKRNNNKIVDIVVSPPLKSLAERLYGVRQVYVAKSTYERETEKNIEKQGDFDAYEKIIVLRLSADFYPVIKSIRADKIETHAWLIAKYGIHLLKSLLFRQYPKQWRDFNFELLKGRPREINLEELLNFKERDYERVSRLLIPNEDRKKIIIHTGTNWAMKRWNIENWIELIEKINKLGDFAFIFVGAGEDKKDYSEISAKLSFSIYSLIGKINLLDLMIFMKTSDFFIGVDSGPSNMSYLTNMKTITIFGPGPHMYLPPKERNIAMDKSRGRGLYQMYFCKKNSFISKIKADEVLEVFKKFL